MHMAMWWVAASHQPTIEEVREKLKLIQEHGETPDAFSFRKPYEPKE